MKRPLRLQARSVAARAAALDQEVLEGEGGLLEGQGRLVQWYPGHIARAERRLQEQLSQVDAVFEVRDARLVPQMLCLLTANTREALAPCAVTERSTSLQDTQLLHGEQDTPVNLPLPDSQVVRQQAAGAGPQPG